MGARCKVVEVMIPVRKGVTEVIVLRRLARLFPSSESRFSSLSTRFRRFWMSIIGLDALFRFGGIAGRRSKFVRRVCAHLDLMSHRPQYSSNIPQILLANVYPVSNLNYKQKVQMKHPQDTKGAAGCPLKKKSNVLKCIGLTWAIYRGAVRVMVAPLLALHPMAKLVKPLLRKRSP
jgi:hypothetical protein